MEVDFGQEAYGTHFDGFMRHYLTVKTGDIPNVREVYEAFKDYARSPNVAKAGVEALVADIRAFARYFCAMALGAEPDPDLKSAFHDLRELKVDVAYPFLLELYHDYATGVLPCDDFVAAVAAGRGLCVPPGHLHIPTNSMNKTFATFAKALKKDRYLESIQAICSCCRPIAAFPADDEFRRDLQTRDLYNFRSRSYWLRRLENYGRKERVPVDEYTIEHIMPQTRTLPCWKTALGPELGAYPQHLVAHPRESNAHGYNADYSDRPFVEKRDMPDDPDKGLKVSPLKLNQGLGQLDHWNEDTIKARAEKLSGTALLVWAAPTLAADVLAAYKPETPTSGYTIEDHPAPAAMVRCVRSSRRSASRCSRSIPASPRNF